MDKEQILKRLLTDFPDAIRNDVSAYTALKVEKVNGNLQNFIQVSPSKITILSRFLTLEEKELFKIAPKTNGWSIDADFTIQSVEDYEAVLPLIKKSYQGVKGSNYWMIIAGGNGSEWERFKSEQVACIDFSPNLTNLLDYQQPKDLQQGKQQNNFIWDFAHKIKIGDVIVATSGQNRIFGLGLCTQTYYYDEKQTNYKHRIGVNWIKVDGNWAYQNKKGTRSTVHRDTNPERIKLYQSILGENANMTSQLNSYTNILKSSKNLILRGAPGTGKSYLAKQIALELTQGKENQIGFVQFHPSYDYTDFVEGLRPISTGDGQIAFARRDGIFKAFCQQALIGQQVGGQDNFLEVWQDFFNQVNEAATDGTYDEVKTLTGKPMHLVAYERSGMTGVTEKNSSSLFFNMEQCYKVYKGLPGVPKGGLDTYRKAIVQHLKTNFGLKDYQPPTGTLDKPFVFIIDEINRGEISKIFGELFFSIDPGYRGKAGAVATQYSNMADGEETFYVPENVYIIGTMNDIDRSVDTFDFAMRRRFRFVEVKAEDTLNMWDGQLSQPQIDEAKERLQRLNQAIEETEELNRNYHIGPAYFLKLRTEELNGDYGALWQDYLEPLLEEYLRGTYHEQENLARLKAAYDGDKEQGDEINGQPVPD